MDRSDDVSSKEALAAWARALGSAHAGGAVPGELTCPPGLADQLDAHGLGPAFAQAFYDKDHWSRLDAVTGKRLREAARQLALRELGWTPVLAHALEALHRAGFPVLVIKGEALARTLYPKRAMRERCDVDLWVHASDFAAASSVLQALGFAPQLAALGFWSLPERTFVANAGGTALPIDLHQNLFSQPLLAAVLDFDQAYSGGTPLPGLQARCPNPAHALLIAVLHRLAHHADCSDRLIWLYDIDLLVRTDPQVLEQAAAIALERGVAGLLAQALSDSAAAFGTPVPAGRLECLRQCGEREAATRLLQPMSAAARRWFDFSTLPNVRARWAYLRELCFPGSAYMAERYGVRSAWTLPWSYARRVAHGIAKMLS